MNTKSITVRVSEAEQQELTRRARAANTRMSRFLVDSALKAAPRNDRQLSDLMGRLCALEVCMQRAADYPTLVEEVRSWKQVTLRMMEGCAWQ